MEVAVRLVHLDVMFVQSLKMNVKNANKIDLLLVASVLQVKRKNYTICYNLFFKELLLKIGFYNFDINDDCLECPEEGLSCKGGSELHLVKGYWRENTKSIVTEFCFNDENLCLGGDGVDPTEIC